MRRVIVWVLLGVTVLPALAYVGRRPLLQAIGGFLIVRHDPRPADAIVVLSGSLPDRIMEAVDLYQAHLAPRLILTREQALPGLEVLRARGVSLPEHHEQNVNVARQLGVPVEAITVMPKPTGSSFAEIQALVTYLRQERIQSILLVTSQAHARRASLIFRRLARGDVQFAICPSRYDPFTADRWWHQRAFVRRVAIEYGKLLTYLFFDRWRVGESDH